MGGDLRRARALQVTPLVSIALVTRNGAATLPALLDSLRGQRLDAAVEIVAVDSGSTDGSAALLERTVDRFVSIPASSFDHGLTRNLAIEQTQGELIVLIVQDALPVADSWLSELTAPLVADARVAGTFARQVPRAGASAITRSYLERAPVTSRASRTFPAVTPQVLGTLDPMARLQRCSFDNVCSCIRRSVWREFPFRQTPIAEDIEWARTVLLAGSRVEFVATAVVLHSHERSPAYEFTRTRALHRRLFELFELRTIPSLPRLTRSIAACLALHLRCERAHPRAWPRAVGLAVAWPLGQYLGGRSGNRAKLSAR